MTRRPGRVAAQIALSPPAARGADYRLTTQFSDAAGRISAAMQEAA
jgi:hypothetical protein